MRKYGQRLVYTHLRKHAYRISTADEIFVSWAVNAREKKE